MFTAIGTTLSFIIIPTLLSTNVRTNQLVAARILFLLDTFFGLALALVGGPFLYPAEIAPLRSCAQLHVIAGAANWIFCFIVLMTIPSSFFNIGWKTYIIYAVLTPPSFRRLLLPRRD